MEDPHKLMVIITILQEEIILTGARQNGIHEGICCFAENSSFCQAHAFEVLTPT